MFLFVNEVLRWWLAPLLNMLLLKLGLRSAVKIPCFIYIAISSGILLLSEQLRRQKWRGDGGAFPGVYALAYGWPTRVQRLLYNINGGS